MTPTSPSIKKWAALALTAILGVMLAGAGPASATTPGTAEHLVRIHGLFAGSVAYTSASTVKFSGHGLATHLGRTTNEGHVVITGPDSSCPGGFANTNVELFTAALGDTLTITSQDVACPVSASAVHGTGHWIVTGGTGRFAGMTGHGTMVGGADFAQGVFDFRLTGTLSPPGQS